LCAVFVFAFDAAHDLAVGLGAGFFFGRMLTAMTVVLSLGSQPCGSN
jgi:hypothetical protein